MARLWGGLTLEEVARLQGCSTTTAHRRYRAGLARLQERLACPTECPRDDLTDLERRLAALRPASGGLDRDRMLFDAGRASARAEGRARAWALSAAASALVAVGLGVGLARERSRALGLERR